METAELIKILDRLEQLEKKLDIALAKEPIKDSPKDKVYEALAKSALEYKPVRFNRINSFNKQVYADLDMIEQATRHALANHGLRFMQEPHDIDGVTFLTSRICHASGQDIVCKNRLIITSYTGAKSDLQRYGEGLAYLKRQVAQCMLGIVAENDPEDNDDADTAEHQYNNESRRSVGGDAKPAHVDKGVFTDKITKSQLQDLLYELQEYPLMTKSLLKALELDALADMPAALYHREIQRIRENKLRLVNTPKKEW